MTDITADAARQGEVARKRSRLGKILRRHPMMVAGGVILVLIAIIAAAAPLLAPHDPIELNVVEIGRAHV